ncbi:hypothetical protein RRP28_28345 [Pseudomonas syringae pv. actinidiae]|nr:hypothetical protein [Pseudomonas syringae]WOK32164.1 hypothetical protein RRP28_28345 [Pseudomonas syringae pv. actinidiae]
MAVKKRTVPKPNANFMLTLIFAKPLFIKSPDYAFLSALKELKICFYGQQNRALELSAAQQQNFIKKRISALALIRGDARGAERPRQVRQPA